MIPPTHEQEIERIVREWSQSKAEPYPLSDLATRAYTARDSEIARLKSRIAELEGLLAEAKKA